MADKAIDDLMLENRKFPPSAAFKKTALVTGTELYDEGAGLYRLEVWRGGFRTATFGAANAPAEDPRP